MEDICTVEEMKEYFNEEIFISLSKKRQKKFKKESLEIQRNKKK